MRKVFSLMALLLVFVLLGACAQQHVKKEYAFADPMSGLAGGGLNLLAEPVYSSDTLTGAMDTYDAELSIYDVDFSVVPRLESAYAFDQFLLRCIEKRYVKVAFVTDDANLCLFDGGSRIANAYLLRACKPEVLDLRNGTYRVLYTLTYFDGENVAHAYRTGDRRNLTVQESAIYDFAAGWIEKNIPKEEPIYDKLLRIHDFICAQTQYYAEAEHDGQTVHTASPYGVFFQGRANCQGYADTFQMLSRMAGIECVKIDGEASGSAHVWNMVRLEDGRWYHVDVTFDDGFDAGPAYAYFCVPDELIMATHRFDTAKTPDAADLDAYYYVKKGLIAFDDTQAQELLSTVFSNRPGAFSLLAGAQVELQHIARLCVQNGYSAVQVKELGDYSVVVAGI
ncbi:MAG: transglutaminase domain-containing protein [Christensenellales bacterium]